jgi:26S proteasome regulatory subunit T1
MNPETTKAFLDGAIRSRIAIRFIAEQHIALTRALKMATSSPSNINRSSGVVDTECSPLEMVNMCKAFVHELCLGTFGVAPEVAIDGMTDVTFPYALILLSLHLASLLTQWSSV